MSTTTPRISYCQFSESQIKESGLLTPERMAAVTAAIDALIVPCCLPDGTVVKNAFVADHGDAGKCVYAQCDSPNANDYMRRGCLPVVLTAQELSLINETCLEARSAAMDKERFAKAEKVESWDGGVWLGDDYFASMDELAEQLVSTGADWPEYVWAASPQVVIRGLDVADVVEDQLADRGWEDMDTHDLHGVEDLQVALKKFVEANASVISFETDYSTAVLTAAWKKESLLSH